jgi:hypothetical protein
MFKKKKINKKKLLKLFGLISLSFFIYNKRDTFKIKGQMFTLTFKEQKKKEYCECAVDAKDGNQIIGEFQGGNYCYLKNTDSECLLNNGKTHKDHHENRNPDGTRITATSKLWAWYHKFDSGEKKYKYGVVDPFFIQKEKEKELEVVQKKYDNIDQKYDNIKGERDTYLKTHNQVQDAKCTKDKKVECISFALKDDNDTSSGSKIVTKCPECNEGQNPESQNVICPVIESILDNECGKEKGFGLAGLRQCIKNSCKKQINN